MSDTAQFNVERHNPELPEARIIFYCFATRVTGWHNPARNAPFWRLYWSCTPGAELHCRDRIIKLDAGSVALIPSHTNFSSHADIAFDQFYIHFTPGARLETCPRQPLVMPSQPFLRQLEMLKQEYENHAALPDLGVYALLFSVLRYVISNPENLAEHRAVDARITSTIALIARKNKRSNRFLAESCHMSVDNFLKLFKAEIGLTPQHYILTRRMEQAQSLLSNTDMTIEEIASETGFADRYHFSKSFKKFFNISPVKYRTRSGFGKSKSDGR